MTEQILKTGAESASTTEPVPEEGATSSLADLILDTEVSTYLPDSMQKGMDFIQQYDVLFAIVILAMGYGLGRALKSLIHFIMGHLSKTERGKLDYEILHYLSSPVLQTCVTFSIVVVIAIFHLPDALERILVHVCFTALVIFWGRAWFRATEAILQWLEKDNERSHLFKGRTLPLYEMGIKLLLVGLFVYLIFLIWGIDATAWIASAGIIGIAVGFAARDTIANLISGVSIVADSPYKIGDYIVLETGERGMVTALGIRSTRILSRDDVEISIPNALIGNAKVVNESGGPWVRHRIRLPIGVAYSSDVHKVMDVLKSIAHDNEHVSDTPEPRVRLRQFADSSIDMDLLCWIRVPAERGIVVHELMLSIIDRFREEAIHIPFPQRDVHLPDKRGKNGLLGDGTSALQDS